MFRATLMAVVVVVGGGICTVTVSAPVQPRVVTGRAAGVLNGMNGSSPQSETIVPLKLQMWRGPMANWLWPNRTSCKGAGTCCTPEACPAPFSEAARLSSLGIRQQYIL
jgi:hypothetical protein